MKSNKIRIFLTFAILIITVKIFAIEIGQNPRFSKRYKEALINNVVFSPDSKIIATTEAKKVQLWDAKSGKLLADIYKYKGKPMFLNFSGSGKLLITGAYGAYDVTKVKVWNVETRELVRNLVSMTSVSSVAISHDDSIAAVSGIVAGDKNKASITLWNLKTGKMIATLKKKKSDIYYPQSLLFSRDSKVLINAIANREHGIEIWNLKTRKRIKYIKTKFDVTVVSLSLDLKILAAGLHIAESRTQKPGGIIRIYSFPSMKKLYDLKGPKGHITSLSFHPGGRFLASGEFGSRPNFSIWDLKKKRIHFKNKKGRRPVLQAIFSPDGKSLAVVLNTYGDMGNPDTFKMIDTGTKSDLKKSGASNDMNTFNVGEHVKAVIDEGNYSGVINKKSKHHYLLKMDNRQPKYWMWVEPGNLRPEE
jgi:WD40 repeat protein